MHTRQGLKNVQPLYNVLGYLHNQTDALQHICDVVDAPFVLNSQGRDSLKEQKRIHPTQLPWPHPVRILVPTMT